MVTAANCEHLRRVNRLFYVAAMASLKQWRSPRRRQELKVLAARLGGIVDAAIRQ